MSGATGDASEGKTGTSTSQGSASSRQTGNSCVGDSASCFHSIRRFVAGGRRCLSFWLNFHWYCGKTAIYSWFVCMGLTTV